MNRVESAVGWHLGAGEKLSVRDKAEHIAESEGISEPVAVRGMHPRDMRKPLDSL